jgi:hypothetical protein
MGFSEAKRGLEIVMTGTISTRTPEGAPNHCPVCDSLICIEPSQPPGDAPCPNCGTLLWFFGTSAGRQGCGSMKQRQ